MQEILAYLFTVFLSARLSFSLAIFLALAVVYMALQYFTRIKPARLYNYQIELRSYGYPGSTCPRCGRQEIILEHGKEEGELRCLSCDLQIEVDEDWLLGKKFILP
jgi:ribosomal protein S27AE